MSRGVVFAAVLALAGTAQVSPSGAAELEPHYGPPGAWVKPVAIPPAPATPSGAPAQALLLDAQDYYGPDGDQFYFEFAGKILTPDGLSALGTLPAEWNPEIESLTIHKLNILRNGAVIDALATDKFMTLRRENNLEKAILDGRLTAAVQLSGLQVGDVVDFAYTLTRKDPILLGRSSGAHSLVHGFDPARIYFSGAWPASKAMHWRATAGLSAAKAQGDGVAITLDGVSTPNPPDGAPPRYKDAGTLEFSSFKDWPEVSALLLPLYQQAATLSPASPLRAEVAKIKAQTSDPELQAGLALRLVQDQVRYLFVGINNGNYAPAPADQTWSRRFGDCKGKTVLLLALLTELGIKAEPVMVNSSGGDGLEKHLPQLSVFDHILVRATIGGHVFWLDGTGAGDRDIRRIAEPPFGWGLPVRTGGADLERVAGDPLPEPLVETVMTIDASSGVDATHPVSVETTVHGGAAVLFSRKAGGMSHDDAYKAFQQSWSKAYGWVEVKSVDWAWDPEAAEFRFSMQGVSKGPDWSTDSSSGGRAFEVDNSAFPKVAALGRPAGQDQSAAFAVDFPAYERAVTVLRLPGDGAGYAVLGDPVQETINGVAYRRYTKLENGSVVMVHSSRALASEVSAAQAKADALKAAGLVQDSVWVRGPAAGDRTTTDPETLVTLGFSMLAVGHPIEARELFDRALSAKADYLPAQLGVAESLAAAKDYDQALAQFDLMLKQHPDLRAALTVARGEVLFEAARYDQAIQSYSEALAKGADAGLLHARAEAYAAMGELDRALADAEAALRLTPGDPGALNLRASLKLGKRQTASALEDFDAAVKLDPDDADNLMGRGAAYMAMKQYDRAIVDFDEARRIDPASISPWQARSGADFAAARYDYAVRDLDHALQLAPGSAILLNARCWARAGGGLQLDLAVADCDAAIKQQPDNAAFLDSRGLAHLRIGRFDEAIADYTAALAHAPRMASALYGRGLAKLRKGDTAAGRADIARAKAISPDVEGDFAKFGMTP
jgi:tetratricopeptide (TPR) repeat protein